MLSLPLAVCLSIAASAEQEPQRPFRPEAVIPLMKRSPEIDGVISPGEWNTLHVDRLVSSGDGILQPRKAEFWLGSDGSKLYLAMRSAVHPTAGVIGDSRPERFKQDAGRLYGGIFGFVAEDYLDVCIDNNPLGKTGTHYRIAVNPLGAIYDVAYDKRVNVAATAFRAKLDQAHKVADGTWTAELAIDPKSLNITDLLAPLAFRIDREFQSPKDYCRWEMPAVNPDFPGQIFLPENMAQVRFVRTGVIVGEAGVQDAEGINVALDLTNPTEGPLPLVVNLGYGPDEQSGQVKDIHVTVPPGQMRRVALRRPFARAEDYTAFAVAAVRDASGRIVYRRQYKWQTHPKDPWEPRKPSGPPPPLEFKISYQPTAGLLRWRADFSRREGREKITRARVVIAKPGSQQPVAEAAVRDLKDFAATARIALGELATASYEARLYLDEGADADAPAAVETFHHQTDFVWKDNGLGISDDVIGPFTPITVNGRTVGTILREHTMSHTGLWTQVRSLDADILAGPMRFEVTQGGQVQPARGELRFTEQKPNRAVGEAEWTAGSLCGRTVSEFDIDGCMKVTVELSQTDGKQIDSLDVVIPLKDEIAPLMHVCGDGLRFNYGGIVPEGQGRVWSSKQASRGNLIGTFVPYLFVGGTDRGLVWFASNDCDWVVDTTERTPGLALERSGGTLTLRIRLIQRPATLTRTHKIIFGLQATPTKPMPADPDWRTWGWGYSAQGKFNIILLGAVMYWGGDYYGVFPQERDFEIVRRIAETIKEGKDNKDFFDEYVAKYPKVKAEVRWSSQQSRKDAVIPYTNLRGAVTDTPEWNVYQDEWLHYDFQPEARSPRPGWQGTDFHVIPTRTRQDFLLYYYREFLRNGFDGIYWDNINIYSNMNPDFGRGYVRDDGQFQPDTDIWEIRNLARRTAVMFHQLGKRNLTMPHMTNAYLIPVFSWATMNYDWEWRYGASDFQDRFTRDYTRAATIGRQAGTAPVILGGIRDVRPDSAEARWVERTRTAVCLVHEVNIDQADALYWKIKKHPGLRRRWRLP